MTDEMKNNEMKKNEVTEEQLEGVSGGNGERAIFAFNIGDRVECNIGVFGTERGTIVERRMKRGLTGLFSSYRKWPEYKIRFDNPSYQETCGNTWLRQSALSY